jgi:diamine N-acetyltransferase
LNRPQASTEERKDTAVAVRQAIPGDEATIFGLVRRLAEYERLEHEVVADEAGIGAALFGPSPRVFCDLAEVGGRVAGFALWFYSFSTFVGRHGIYLEDLFVEPEHRGSGIGKALLANLARRCVEEGLGRLEWSVLDWNAPAIAFYRGRGARLLDDWRTCRVTGPALAAMAAGEGGAR